jgi:hypothetical protein
LILLGFFLLLFLKKKQRQLTLLSKLVNDELIEQDDEI